MKTFYDHFIDAFSSKGFSKEYIEREASSGLIFILCETASESYWREMANEAIKSERIFIDACLKEKSLPDLKTLTGSDPKKIPFP